MTAARPFEAYRGDEDFVFVCYAHADAARVFPEMRRLHAQGLRQWYDEGIDAGREWRSEIADALERASAVLFFQSAASVASRHCHREIGYALDRDLAVVRVLLDDAELPPALRLGLGAEQAIDTRLDPDDVWRRKLNDALVAPREPPPIADDASPPRSGWRFALAALIAVVTVSVLAVFLGGAPEDGVGSASVAPDADALEARLLDGDERSVFEEVAALRAQGRLSDELRRRLRDARFGFPLRLRTDPPGAQLSVRPLAGGDWMPLGPAPLVDDSLGDVSDLLWRLEAPGHRTRELYLPSDWLARPFRFKSALVLDPDGVDDDGMAPVPRLANPSPWIANYLIELDPELVVESFRIAVDETTNREFKAFVDAGGYGDPAYWEHLEFEDVDGTISREEALARMVDSTGRPGPATWEYGSFPPGQGDHPVGGISWYEARAYARFRDAALPTVQHWVSATWPLSAQRLVPLSNFGGSGSRPVQESPPSFLGLRDSFGNVREWLANATETGHRWIQGGAWDDPPYLGLQPFALPPLDRDPRNGVRIARFDPVPALETPIAQAYARVQRELPVGDEAYAVIREQYRLPDAPLDAVVEFERVSDWWRHEVVQLRTGDGDEHFRIHLFLPPQGQGPHQAVVLFPWSAAFLYERDSVDDLRPNVVDFLPRAGRAIVYPVWWGSYERWVPGSGEGAFWIDREPELLARWHVELSRTLDYLETRSDVDADRIGYFGNSMGGNQAMPLLAMEPRLKAAVLSAGGLGSLLHAPTVALADPVNFLPRITQPTLMLNGEYDFIFPPESQQLLFDLLGTPDAKKERVVYPLGHGAYPEQEFRRRVIDWYDRYLGPVRR